MKVHLNGGVRQLAADITDIARLVASLDLPAETALVEHNGTALRRAEWPGRTLQEDDRVEIIRIVAGG